MKITGIPADLALHSLTLTGDLTVGGGATVVGELTSESVYETLNSDKTSGAPTEDMGFRARRGASPWWVVGWDETNDRTIIGTSTDGTVANTTGGAVVVGSLLAGNGSAAAPSYSFSGAATTGFYYSSTPILAIAGTQAHTWGSDYFQINNAGARLLFSSDVILTRDAANVLAQRNSTNPQTLRVYGTYTDASNNEFLAFKANAGAEFQIIATKSGTGTYRSISFVTSGLGRWYVNENGVLGCHVDNTVDLGASGTARPRSIYAGTSFIAPAGSSAAPSYTFAGSAASLASGIYATNVDVNGCDLVFKFATSSGKSAIFQNASAASLLTIAAGSVTATVPFLAPDGSTTNPSIAFSTTPGNGFYYINSTTFGASTGALVRFVFSGVDFKVGPTGLFGFGSASALSAPDTGLARLAAASLRLGAAPSATPIAQTFTIGEASRPGTDTNVGGASATIRSGLGTGTGAASSIVFQTPTLVASGSLTQTYADRLTVATAGITATVPVLYPNGTEGAPVVAPSGAPTYGFYFSATSAWYTSGGTTTIRFSDGIVMRSVSAIQWTSSTAGAASDLSLTRHSAANLRQGTAAAADADGVAQTLRSPGGGTVSAGTTGRAGGAYTITAGNGSDAKSGSNANGGNGGLLTLTGGAKGLKDGGGSDGLDGGVQVSRSGGLLGFYGVSPIARAVLATGAGATVDDVITALQNLGLVKQS